MDFNTQEGQTQAAMGQIIGGPAGLGMALTAWVKDYQTGLSQQGKFEVDPERLPQLKADLDAVKEEAQKALEVSTEVAMFQGPAEDDVSVQAMQNINQVMTDGDGSLAKTCDDVMRWVESFQEEVEKAIAEYQRIDDENRMA